MFKVGDEVVLKAGGSTVMAVTEVGSGTGEGWVKLVYEENGVVRDKDLPVAVLKAAPKQTP